MTAETTNDTKRFICQICDNDYTYTGNNLSQHRKGKYKVCPTCKSTLPGEGNTINSCKLCHALFFGTNNRCRYCPNCIIKVKSLACIICNKNYIDSCIKINNSAIKVCPECRATLPGKGNCIKECKTCSSIFKTTNNTCYCLICSKNRKTFTCQICNQEYAYEGDNFDYYINKASIRICKECEITLPGEGEITAKCQLCNCIFKTKGTTVHFCPTCIEESKTPESVKRCRDHQCWLEENGKPSP